VRQTMAAAPIHPFKVMQTALQSMADGLEQASHCDVGPGVSKESLHAICEPYFKQMLIALEQAMEQALEARLEQALKGKYHFYSTFCEPAESDATLATQASLGEELRAFRKALKENPLQSSDDESLNTEVCETSPSNIMHASDSDLTESRHKSRDPKSVRTWANLRNLKTVVSCPRCKTTLADDSGDSDNSTPKRQFAVRRSSLALPIRQKNVKGQRLHHSKASEPALSAQLASWMDSFFQSLAEPDMERETSWDPDDSECGWPQ